MRVTEQVFAPFVQATVYTSFLFCFLHHLCEIIHLVDGALFFKLPDYTVISCTF